MEHRHQEVALKTLNNYFEAF